MDKEKRKKFVEFENAVDHLISEKLTEMSKKDIKEYYGNHPLGKVIIDHIETYEGIEGRMKKK